MMAVGCRIRILVGGVELDAQEIEQEKVSVGSAPGCTIRLLGKEVAPAHLELTVLSNSVIALAAGDATFRFKDAATREALVWPGDELEVGPYRLQLERVGAAQQQAADRGAHDQPAGAGLPAGPAGAGAEASTHPTFRDFRRHLEGAAPLPLDRPRPGSVRTATPGRTEQPAVVLERWSLALQTPQPSHTPRTATPASPGAGPAVVLERWSPALQTPQQPQAPRTATPASPGAGPAVVLERWSPALQTPQPSHTPRTATPASPGAGPAVVLERWSPALRAGTPGLQPEEGAGSNPAAVRLERGSPARRAGEEARNAPTYEPAPVVPGSPDLGPIPWQAVPEPAPGWSVPRLEPALVPRLEPALVPRLEPPLVPLAEPPLVPRLEPPLVPRLEPPLVLLAEPRLEPPLAPSPVACVPLAAEPSEPSEPEAAGSVPVEASVPSEPELADWTEPEGLASARGPGGDRPPHRSRSGAGAEAGTHQWPDQATVQHEQVPLIGPEPEAAAVPMGQGVAEPPEPRGAAQPVEPEVAAPVEVEVAAPVEPEVAAPVEPGSTGPEEETASLVAPGAARPVGAEHATPVAPGRAVLPAARQPAPRAFRQPGPGSREEIAAEETRKEHNSPVRGMPLPLPLCLLVSVLLHLPLLLWPAEPLSDMARAQVERRWRIRYVETSQQRVSKAASRPPAIPSRAPAFLERRPPAPRMAEEPSPQPDPGARGPGLLDPPPLPPSGGKATAIFLKYFGQPWRPLPIGRGGDGPALDAAPPAGVGGGAYDLPPVLPVATSSPARALAPGEPGQSAIAAHIQSMQQSGQERKARDKALRASLQQLPIQVKGGLEEKIVLRTIRAELNAIRICYENALWDHPELQGRVTVRFVIAGSGRVTEVNLASLVIQDAALLKCIENRFRAMKFPAFPGAEVKVNYSLVLSPKA